MSSSLQALSEAMTREAGLGGSRSLIIEAENGAILVLGITASAARASLSVVASSADSLGQLLWAARNCCKSLEETLRR
jgi:predicted regulator of Ras-like GTPase activity (Roadblock/LC7/MglB family)